MSLNKQSGEVLYETLVELLKKHGKETTQAEWFKEPIYLTNHPELIRNYIIPVRRLQDIVRRKVRFSIDIGYTSEEPFDELFDIHNYGLYEESENWGLWDDEFGIDEIPTPTGHAYSTVYDAKFKGRNIRKARQIITQIKRIREDMEEEYEPIRKVLIKSEEAYDKYSSIWRLGHPDRSFGELCGDELRRVNEYGELFSAETVLVRKGILSLCLVNSLVHKLEDSIDLAKYHPGD